MIQRDALVFKKGKPRPCKNHNEHCVAMKLQLFREAMLFLHSQMEKRNTLCLFPFSHKEE